MHAASDEKQPEPDVGESPIMVAIVGVKLALWGVYGARRGWPSLGCPVARRRSASKQCRSSKILAGYGIAGKRTATQHF